MKNTKPKYSHANNLLVRPVLDCRSPPIICAIPAEAVATHIGKASNAITNLAKNICQMVNAKPNPEMSISITPKTIKNFPKLLTLDCVCIFLLHFGQVGLVVNVSASHLRHQKISVSLVIIFQFEISNRRKIIVVAISVANHLIDA